jgi:hypothetical protein
MAGYILMLRYLVVGAALLTLPAAADPLEPPPVTYPMLAAQAADPKGFAPAGWIVEEAASGDLNNDGRADIAFVLRDTDPKNILPNDNGLGSNPFDTNPRILGIAFAKARGGFALAAQDHTLIQRRDSPTMEDPFEVPGIDIARGALNVRLHLFMNAGGWEMFNSRFTLRWQNRQFQLIGFERMSTMRNTGATELTSVNYSTSRMVVETGSIENDATSKRTTTLPKKPLLALDQIGPGLDFDPGS